MDKITGVKALIIDALRDKPHPTHLSVGQALEIASRVQPNETYFTHIAHELPQSAEDRLPPRNEDCLRWTEARFLMNRRLF